MAGLSLGDVRRPQTARYVAGIESAIVHYGSSTGFFGKRMFEGGPGYLRDSQTATLKILRQRLDNLERCDESLQQVDSDLARVEAQVDLAVESAALRGGGAAVTANLELASQALDGGIDFGESEATVQALDQAYAAPPRLRERA